MTGGRGRYLSAGSPSQLLTKLYTTHTHVHSPGLTDSTRDTGLSTPASIHVTWLGDPTRGLSWDSLRSSNALESKVLGQGSTFVHCRSCDVGPPGWQLLGDSLIKVKPSLLRKKVISLFKIRTNINHSFHPRTVYGAIQCTINYKPESCHVVTFWIMKMNSNTTLNARTEDMTYHSGVP